MLIPPQPCSVTGCEGRHHALKLCEAHYRRWVRRRARDPHADLAQLKASWGQKEPIRRDAIPFELTGDQKETLRRAAIPLGLTADEIDEVRAEARGPIQRVGTPAERPGDAEALATARQMNVLVECEPDLWIRERHPEAVR